MKIQHVLQNCNWPYWLLLCWLDWVTGRFSIHFIMADHCSQSNLRGHRIISTSSQRRPREGNRKISISLGLPWPSSSNENQQSQWKSAISANQHTPANSLLAQPAVAAFPGASQPSQGPASSLPSAASQQSPRGQPAVSQSTSQSGIIHTHLDHVNMSQCTFSFYVICYCTVLVV